jgi:ATP-binding cassette subfamily B protein
MKKGCIDQYVRVNSTLSFILASIKQFKFYVIWLFVTPIIWSIDISLKSYLLKIMVDRAENTDYSSALAAFSEPVIFYILLLIVVFVASRFDDFIWLKLRPNLQKYIGIKLMKRMMSHSADLYQNHFAGSLVNKINDVIGGIPDILKICIHQLFGNVLTLVIASYTLYQTNSKFAAVFIFWGGMFIVVSFKLSAKASNLSKDVADIRSRLVGYKADTLSNITTIRLFTGQKYEIQGLITAFDKLVLATHGRDWFFLKISTFQGGSFVLYQIICLWLLVIGLKRSTITPGDFILVLTINISLIQILWNFSYYIHDLAEVIGRVNQGLSIVLMPIQIKDTEYAEVLKVTDREIIFDAVKFGYKNPDLLFDNLSIKIDPYQKVGLVGYSGSGKTTFVNLILRLYDINEGRILIDGQNIREVTQTSLRKAIGVIPQDPILFHRSIRDNIGYSRPEATEEEIITAAKKAQAHQFIVELPEGYDSLVGERGVKLSGGQRQRIAIARAFLKNPPILILDEATSQLDSITEGLIQNSLLELFEGKTTLTVAHRLSTLMYMDRILVFDQGKIVEEGSHAQLLRFKGLYKNMWDAQVGGFLPEHK